jgi:hypothetical protein
VQYRSIFASYVAGQLDVVRIGMRTCAHRGLDSGGVRSLDHIGCHPYQPLGVDWRLAMLMDGTISAPCFIKHDAYNICVTLVYFGK